MSKKIEKLLSRDKERLVQRALKSSKYVGCEYPYVMDIDEDKSEAYFEIWTDEGYKVYSVEFTLNTDMTKAEITSEPKEVVEQTQYVKVSDMDNILTKAFNKFTKLLTGREPLQVIKQFNDEEMVAIEPLYIEPDGVDGHGWTASSEVLKSMTESCNTAIQEGRLLAKYNHKTETEDFTFVKAWVNEVDCQIGEHFVPEGQPIIKIQFTNKEAWEKRKSGELCGVSIGAIGVWEDIDE